MSLERIKITGEFEQIHDAFLRTWDEAMSTGVTTEVEKAYSEEYFVTFLPGAHEKPNIEDRVSAIEGLRDSVAALRGAMKRCENRIVRVRNSKNIFVFYEQSFERDGEELARLLIIEDWRLLDDGWRIIRETTEVV